MSDDFPMPVKLRMWAFMALSGIGDTSARLDYSDALVDFLWSDFETVEIVAKEDIN